MVHEGLHRQGLAEGPWCLGCELGERKSLGQKLFTVIGLDVHAVLIILKKHSSRACLDSASGGYLILA